MLRGFWRDGGLLLSSLRPLVSEAFGEHRWLWSGSRSRDGPAGTRMPRRRDGMGQPRATSEGTSLSGRTRGDTGARRGQGMSSGLSQPRGQPPRPTGRTSTRPGSS